MIGRVQTLTWGRTPAWQSVLRKEWLLMWMLGINLIVRIHSLGELFRRGKKRAGLGVDSESLTGATRLFQKAGMHQERRYNNSYEKELRPGRDLRIKSVQDRVSRVEFHFVSFRRESDAV